jgi:DNA mismatch endonuclease (patch repair protein)
VQHVDYWVAKVNRNVSRDQQVDALLREAGWTVVRVWEHDDPAAAADRIEAAVRETSTGRPGRGRNDEAPRRG